MVTVDSCYTTNKIKVEKLVVSTLIDFNLPFNTANHLGSSPEPTCLTMNLKLHNQILLKNISKLTNLNCLVIRQNRV